MGFKARELEGMSKAELIKALRASVAREAKLKKKYDGLLDQLAKRACEPNPEPSFDEVQRAVTAAEFGGMPRPGQSSLNELAPATAAYLAECGEIASEAAKLPGIGPCKPVPGALVLEDEHLNPLTVNVSKPAAFPWEPK